jgi:Sec-independent protein secretion pathway component TatC
MDDKIIISIFMGLEGVHAYSAFLPSVFTIKTFVQDEDGVKMIREGEIMASAYLLILAFAVSYLTKSKWPAIMALATGAAMIGVYEYALARSPAKCGCGGENSGNAYY